MKKPLFLALNFFMLTSLLGGCAFTKTEEKLDKSASESIQNEKVLQGDFVKNEIEEKFPSTSVKENDGEGKTEEMLENTLKQETTVEGYGLNTEGNIITVDLENSGGRNYPEEGLDRGVEFDITNAEKEVIPTSDYLEDRECRIRTGLTVSITYYKENGKNIVTKISTDNDEKEMVVYVSSGKIEEFTEETIKININEGDHNGETITFHTSEVTIPQEAGVNSIVSVTYYLKENTYYAISVNSIDL